VSTTLAASSRLPNASRVTIRCPRRKAGCFGSMASSHSRSVNRPLARLAVGAAYENHQMLKALSVTRGYRSPKAV